MTYRSKFFYGLTTVALAATMFSGAASAYSKNGNEITLRMGSGHSDLVTYVAYMKKQFADHVSERAAKETKYKVKFSHHYGGSLVKVHDTLEGVQDGRLDIGGWCVCFDDDKAMALNITYFVPFSDPNGNKQVKILSRLIKEFPELYQDLEKRYKQRLLAVGGFGNYGLLTAFDWNEFKELNNKKILAAGPNLPWVEGIAIPVRTTIPTAAQQLSTGVGEGIVLFPDTDFKLKFHEAAGKNSVYTVTDFGNIIQNVMTINERTAKRLPPEVLKIIEEEAIELGSRIRPPRRSRTINGVSTCCQGRREGQDDLAGGPEGVGDASEGLAERTRAGRQGQEEHRHAQDHARLHQVHGRRGLQDPDRV